MQYLASGVGWITFIELYAMISVGFALYRLAYPGNSQHQAECCQTCGG